MSHILFAVGGTMNTMMALDSW